MKNSFFVHQENDNTRITDLSVLFVITERLNVNHQHYVVVLRWFKRLPISRVHKSTI